jgi:hypothetical protein
MKPGSRSLIAQRRLPKQKWGPALLPAPTAPSEGSAGQSRSRSRRIISQKSELTSSGVASHRRNTRRAFHRCSAALLGSITLGVPLCFSRFRRSVPNRVALEGRSTLPAPLPDWPRNTPRSISLPVGGDRFFRPPPLHLAVAGLPVRRGLPSRSPKNNAPVG